MIKGQSLFKLQALCSHVIFRVRLGPAAHPSALVSGGRPAALAQSGVQCWPVLVNWWQMLASFGVLTRDGGWFLNASLCLASGCEIVWLFWVFISEQRLW